MPASSHRLADDPASRHAGPAAGRRAGRPFLGIIDPVIVDGPAAFRFDGAIGSDDAAAAWTWMSRDLAPELLGSGFGDGPAATPAELEPLLPELLARAHAALAAAGGSDELARRLTAQLGGDTALARLPMVLAALRCRGLIDKAQGFGRAANAMADEAALALALQSMPLADPPVAALLLHAAVGQLAAPTKLVAAAIRVAGGASEQALARAGLGPLLDAMMAHAQNQIPPLSEAGPFGDMDLVCRSVDRFHRLLRAVTGYVEFGRGSRWPAVAAGLTKAVTDRLEPKLRDVAPDLNQSLRRRDGTDRLDADRILAALNGMYLLATVRDSRDSLALNALFDQVWLHVGQALEIHIERLLPQVRGDVRDTLAAGRFDAALKMAEIRFGREYAETIGRARESEQRG